MQESEQTGHAHSFARYSDLSESAFVVFGTGAGVGQSVVRGLAANGVRVVCVDLSQEAAEQAAALAESDIAIRADLREPDAVRTVLDRATREVGPLRGVVDVVGMLRPGTIAETDDATWRWHFDVVFEHARRLAREAAHLLGHGGCLTYVASAAGMAGVRNNAAYAAAKAAQISLIRSAAAEFGPAGVRVNGVAPGMIANQRMLKFLADVGGMMKARAVIPMGRLVEPDEVADAVLYLSSAAASIVTGQILVLDGGVQHTWPYPDL
ncbi:glucose 1-dehydrogenase [Pseudonocardia yunnanensis]